jgi:hypothetical protein
MWAQATPTRQALAVTLDVEVPDVETYHTLVERAKQITQLCTQHGGKRTLIQQPD